MWEFTQINISSSSEVKVLWQDLSSWKVRNSLGFLFAGGNFFLVSIGLIAIVPVEAVVWKAFFWGSKISL